MAKPMTVRMLMTFGLGGIVGLFAGLALESSGDVADSARSERDVATQDAAEARERVRELEAELRERGSRPRVDAAAEAPREGGGTVESSPSAAPSAADAAEPSSAEKESRIAALRAQTPLWLDRGDGEAAVAALRELAAIVPEGRQAAMELALLINADVNGEGKLRLSDVQFYVGLGDPAVKTLMDWALVRPETPSGFRVMAAWSLPWTQPPSKTLEQFARALAGEPSSDVQEALVANLGRLKNPEADRLLGGILADADRDAGLRAQVAGALATTADEGLVRGLEIAAEKDEDPQVRDAARAALVARNPPASGYLVTGTLPDSQAAAAGLRAGDVLVSYNGQATRSLDALRDAAGEASGAETVAVVVVRDGEEVTLQMRPGKLGIFGRSVEASDE